ncbi:MAG: UPF0058 family protein [Haloarculaceae archaeon]
MRKDELLYLHQLLAFARREYERRDDVDEDALGRYESLSVSPMAAYESKGEHERAVLALAAALAAAEASPTDRGDVRHPASS